MILGIDISKYQSGIDLTSAKNEGVKFCILRAGYTGYGTGKNLAKDNCFETHYTNAKSNGLGVGAYWFSRAINYNEGVKEAQYMIDNCLKGKQFEYPIYIDVEDTYYQIKAGKDAVTKAIKGFCETIEKSGYYVGIYANSNWFSNYINTNELNTYDKWIANWGVAKPQSPKGGMWQFGGETNKLRSNTIAGMVCDQDYAFYDYPTIIKNKKLNGFGTTTSSSTTNSTSTTLKYKVGDKVKFTGTLYSDSYGNGAGAKKTNLNATITIAKAGAKKPYNINNGLGWVAESDLTKVSASSTKITYTVQNGDNLSKIGAKYGVSWKTIYERNKSTIGNNPNLIKAGQVLVIKD